MKTKWKQGKLSTLCHRIGDGLHGTPNYTTGTDYFFINGNNLENGKIAITGETKTVAEAEYKKHFIDLNENTLLLGINGTIGNMAFYSEEQIMLGKSAAYLNFKTNINRFYYYYFQLNGVHKYFYDVATGSTIKNLSLKSIQDFNVPIPDESEYKEIVATLAIIDKKIELNNKINAKLEQMAKTLYDYWFVQFDFPDVNGKPYKSSGGPMVYNEELKQEIPKNWSSISIESLLATSKNGDWGEDSPDRNLMQVYCVRGADINALNGQSATLEPPVRYIRKDHNERLLKPGDLIVEISGGSPTQSTGRIAHIGEKVFNRFETPLVCSNFCKAISFKENKHSHIVKHYWNKLYEAGIFFNFEGKTSGIKNLMFDRVVQDVHLAMPEDKKIVDDFYKIVSQIDEQIQANLLQNQKLVELRDWLLPMLMNGQVTVK